MGDMRRGPRISTAAAALLVAAVLSGCGIPGPGPAPIVSPPFGSEQEPPSLAPPAPLAPAPTTTTATRSGKVPVVEHVPLAVAVGQPDLQIEPPAEQAPEAPAPPPAPPIPSASATPQATPTPVPAPALADRLASADALPPLSWSGGTEGWSLVAGPTAVAAREAIAHVAAAQGAGGDCAAAAAAVDGGATAAAMEALSAGAPGGPYSLVVLRYPSADEAGAAVAALQALGEVCAGVVTDSGTFATAAPAHDATVLLTADGVSLAVDGIASGAHLIAVLHEDAPIEAVALLLREQAALLG